MSTTKRGGKRGGTGESSHFSRRHRRLQKKRREELDNVPARLRKPVDRGDPAEYRRQQKAYYVHVDKMLCKQLAFKCWRIWIGFRKRVARCLVSNMAGAHTGGSGAEPKRPTVAVPHWAEAGRFIVGYPGGQIIPMPDSPEPPELQDNELAFSIGDLNSLGSTTERVGRSVNVPM